MNAKQLNIILRNNTGNKSKESLIDSFVVRTKPFQNIFDEIRLSRTDKPEQNYLVIGQRGAGKTTLLHRLKYAIEDDADINTYIVPVMFAEEQYNLMELADLWESTIEYLEEKKEFESLVQEIKMISLTTKNKEELFYDRLEHWLFKVNKKLILFIENIDTFFKKIGKPGQKRLREVLTTSTRVRLIASATNFFEGITNYSEPFYEFFKIIQLDGLTHEESIALLLKLGELTNESDHIKEIIREHPQRLESLRRLTGGNPRILSYLFQIFLDNENGKAILDLYKLLDEITFLYKAELDQLSPQQQKIVDAIARSWDAIATKDIVAKTNIDSKHVSAILKTLEKNQIIETVNTKTKNNLYLLKDRFLNIWYLMRFGRSQDKKSVVWLVRFYDAWCDKSELSEKVLQHIKNLKEGNYDPAAALDMGNVFLSCQNVTPEIRYDLFKTTKSVLPKSKVAELRISENTIYDAIKELAKKKKYDQAISFLNENANTPNYFQYASWLYHKKGDFIKSLEVLESEYTKRPSAELLLRIGLGQLAFTKNISKSIESFKEALKLELWEAAFYLGEIYYNEYNDLDKAEEYYRIAIKQGHKKAIMNLAKILFVEGKLEKAEELVKLSISIGNKESKLNLGNIYEAQGEFSKAVNIYEEALNDDIYAANIMLGRLYMTINKKEYSKAKKYFEAALEKGINDANYFLGQLYIKQRKNKLAEKYLLDAAKKDARAFHVLGHFYADKNWEKAERYFIKSLKEGKGKSLMCLFEEAFNQRREDRKEYILKQFENKIDTVNKSIIFQLGYARLLLWCDKYEKSLNMLSKIQTKSIQILDGKDEELKEGLLGELTSFFILLISKGQYNAAYDLFTNAEIDFKSLLKPVYYALMNYMKSVYPNESLKAGHELDETINEIIKNIEDLKGKSSHIIN